jgi:GDPmannose 4,6-dehydratase
MKRALITGITGQDGYYLGKLLHTKGYEVYGMMRGQLNPHRARLEKELPEVELVEGDLLDQMSLCRLVDRLQPTEIYNLGAISYVPVSWQQPELVMQVTGIGPIRLLEAIRQVNMKIKMYQASSSEMFGNPVESPQDEMTPLKPRSIYGVAKLAAHTAVRVYRESYGIFACSGIAFNHESSHRGSVFVTKKIIETAVRSLKTGEILHLGNLSARRDWGYAPEYVEAMWLMMESSVPDDFIIATGETHSVEDFVREVYTRVGLDWRKCVVANTSIDIRPAELDTLQGNPAKIKKDLGWEAQTKFHKLIGIMVKAEMAKAELELSATKPKEAVLVK